MNKKILFLLLPILLITSCSNDITTSFSSDTLPDINDSSSSLIKHDPITLDDSNIRSVLLSLIDMDDIVSNKVSNSSLCYSSWGDIEVVMSSNKTLYKDNILEDKSSQDYGETIYNSISQVYQDDTYLYEVTYFKKGDADNTFKKTLLSKLDESSLSSKYDLRNNTYLYNISYKILNDKITSSHIYELNLNGTYDIDKNLYDIDIDYKTKDIVSDNSTYDTLVMNYKLNLEILDNKITYSDESVIEQASYNNSVQYTNTQRSTITYSYDELSSYSGTLLKEEDM